jgi:hypothetical protein
MVNAKASAVRILVLCLLALGALPSCSRAGQHNVAPAVERAEDLTKERIEGLLRESPQEYLAAVQEVVDDSKCYGPADGSSCPLMVKVVNFIAGESGRSAERQLGWVYPTMEMRMEKPWPNRRIGRPRLVLAFPVKSRPGWYGNRIFILDPTPEDVQRLRDILSAIAAESTGRLSNNRLNPTQSAVTALAQCSKRRAVGRAG